MATQSPPNLGDGEGALDGGEPRDWVSDAGKVEGVEDSEAGVAMATSLAIVVLNLGLQASVLGGVRLSPAICREGHRTRLVPYGQASEKRLL